MNLNKFIWVSGAIGYGAVMYYEIMIDESVLTAKQLKLVRRWMDLEGRTFDSYRLAQDIVNMARQQMKEKLQ